MKKLFLLLTLFGVLCSSCTDSGDDVKNPQRPSPEDSVFTISGDGSYVVGAEGGNVVVEVTTNLAYKVVIPEEVSWLTLAESRAVREESLTFIVEKNEELEERSVVVVIVDAQGKELKSLNIKQEAEEPVFTTDSEGNYIIKAEGGDVVVNVTTNLEYDIVIPADASWVTIAESRAVREEMLTFSVAENDNLEARTAVVALVCADGKELQSITINQNGADPVFTIDGEGNYIVEAVGGDISVKVTTNLEYEVVIPEEVEWLTLTDTRAVREETLRFTISENEELEERSAMVVLRGLDGEVLQSITIKQKGADPLFESDAESEYTVEAKGGEVLVKVTTNLQYDVVIAEDASWVAVGDTRAVREETLRFTASENEELEERSAVVELKGVDGEVLQSFTIKQKGADPLFTTDGEGNYLVEAEGGNIAVNITTNLEYDVVIEEDVSWVSVLDTRAVREETLTVAVAKNEEFEERSATLLLVDSNNNTLQEITITQESDAANVPDNQIWYLATSQIAPNAEAVFGANIISHDFADGKGVITFDGAVTSITNSAFAKCADVTMIALPQSVESIEEGCFSECANLEMLISSFATLDNRALVVDGVMVAFAPKGLTSYTTPATARRIGEYTFAYCMELVNVTIDYDTEVIGAWSFTHCEELVNAHIADSVTTIEAGAFSYCYKLGMSGAYTVEDGFIMRGGTIIGSTGSYGGGGGGGADGGGGYGGGGGYLNIPSGATSIATEAFKNYKEINEIVIPASVTEIYAWAFTGCSSLIRVICEPSVPPTAVFVDEIWDAFDGQHADRKIYVPRHSVMAYREAEGWKEYADDIVSIDGIDPNIPDTYIITYTATSKVEPYSGEYNNFADALTSFGANIISNEWDATTGNGVITFDSDVTKIGLWAFGSCINLTGITIPNSVTEIEQFAFEHCIFTSITIPDSVTTIADESFGGCSHLYEFKGKFASEDGRCLIVDDVLKAFAPAGLTEYTIPYGVVEIGRGTFFRYKGITSVTIPNSVIKIGFGAFEDCSSLTHMVIPNSVTEISEYAFNRCDSLDSIHCTSTIPPHLGIFAFWNTNTKTQLYCKIYVPAESYQDYISADNWMEYAVNIRPYDYKNNCTIESGVSEDTVRWLGKWNSTVNWTYCPDMGWNDEPVTFEINIEHNTVAPNLVKIYGLSVVDPTIAVDGVVNRDGDLVILNYNYAGYDGEWLFYMWALSESGKLSYNRHAVYTMSMDESGNVSCNVGSLNGSPYIVFDIFAYNTNTGDILWYDNSISYYSGPMSWMKIENGPAALCSYSATVPYRANFQPQVDTRLKVVE